MSDQPSPSPPKPLLFSLPSLESLTKSQEEEDAEAPEIFFQAKKRKSQDGTPQPTEQVLLDSSTKSSTNSSNDPNAPAALGTSSRSLASPSLSLFSRSRGSKSTLPSLALPPRIVQSSSTTTTFQGQVLSSTIDPSVLLVNPRQSENPVLKHVRHVKWQLAKEIIPDFQFSPTECGLFLSMKFHQLRSNYIHDRIATLPSNYVTRVLLVLVDMFDHEQAMLSINTLAVMKDMVLLLAFSELEAARFLETYKAFENKSADTIKEKPKLDYLSQAGDVLTAVRPVNSKDVVNLLQTFGSIAKIFTASMEQLSVVPGLGEKKVRRLYNACHQPFLSSAAFLKPLAAPSKSHITGIMAFMKGKQAPPSMGTNSNVIRSLDTNIDPDIEKTLEEEN